MAARSSGAAPLAARTIAPPVRWPRPDLAALAQARGVIYFLAWRDIKVRYKQAALGAAWAVLQPALTMALFALFLGKLAGVPSDGLPYPLFALSALVIWQLFAYSLTEASLSVVSNERLVTKVYFPRLAIPLAATLAGLVDFSISLAFLAGVLAWYGVALSWNVVWAPLFVAMALLAGIGTSLWLSALNVRYRDVRYTIPFLAQTWLFLSPIAYPASLVPERWLALYSLNPMAGIVQGFRWSLLGGPPPSPTMLAAAAAFIVIALAGGLLYFRRTEQRFADII